MLVTGSECFIVTRCHCSPLVYLQDYVVSGKNGRPGMLSKASRVTCEAPVLLAMYGGVYEGVMA